MFVLTIIAMMLVGCKKENVTPAPKPGPDDPRPAPVYESEFKFLGRGYDASGRYADEADVKAPVLSQTAMLKHGYIDEVKSPLSLVSYTTYGKDITEYETKISQAIELKTDTKFGKWGFKASLKESFADNAIATKENSYCTMRYSKEMKSYNILSNATPDKLKECLSSTFLYDISCGKYTAGELVDMYGTHVIAGFSMGGRTEFSISAMNSTDKAESDFKIMAEVGHNAKIGKIKTESSVSPEFEQYKKFKTESKNFSERITCRGGESSKLNFEGADAERKASYSAWDESLNDESKQVLVEFAQNGGLIPLYKFIDDKTLAAQVEAVIQDRLDNPVEQNSAYRNLVVYFEKLDGSHYRSRAGVWGMKDHHHKLYFDMTVQSDNALTHIGKPSTGAVYLYDTRSNDVNIRGGELGHDYLFLDYGDVPTHDPNGNPVLDFKNGTCGTSYHEDQKKQLEKGEPYVTLRLNRWSNNEVNINVNKFEEKNEWPVSSDSFENVTVKMTCAAGAEVWAYKATGSANDKYVYDRNSGHKDNSEIEILCGSKNRSGQYIRFVLEIDWNDKNKK